MIMDLDVVPLVQCTHEFCVTKESVNEICASKLITPEYEPATTENALKPCHTSDERHPSIDEEH